MTVRQPLPHRSRRARRPLRQGLVALAVAGLAAPLVAVAPASAAPSSVGAGFPAIQLQDPDVNVCPPAQVPAAPFTDLAGSPFPGAIACVTAYGLAQGTSATEFSPDASVTRGQMLLFLDRLSDQLGVRTDDLAVPAIGFPDLTPAQTDALLRLSALGVVQGREDGSFGAQEAVTRGQMAAFLGRLLAYASSLQDSPYGYGQEWFRDDDGSVFSQQINSLASAGIVTGTEQPDFDTNVGDFRGLFSPDAPVTRAQLAVFLSRTLEMAVEDLDPLYAGYLKPRFAALDEDLTVTPRAAELDVPTSSAAPAVRTWQVPAPPEGQVVTVELFDARTVFRFPDGATGFLVPFDPDSFDLTDIPFVPGQENFPPRGFIDEFSSNLYGGPFAGQGPLVMPVDRPEGEAPEPGAPVEPVPGVVAAQVVAVGGEAVDPSRTVEVTADDATGGRAEITVATRADEVVVPVVHVGAGPLLVDPADGTTTIPFGVGAPVRFVGPAAGPGTAEGVVLSTADPIANAVSGGPVGGAVLRYSYDEGDAFFVDRQRSSLQAFEAVVPFGGRLTISYQPGGESRFSITTPGNAAFKSSGASDGSVTADTGRVALQRQRQLHAG